MNINSPTSIDDIFDTQASLSAGFPDSMVLLDCETTGGKAAYHRVIEIGLLVVDDGVVTEHWHTLIDPGVPIPEGIQKLTGIEPSMLVGKPSFAEVAGLLLEKLNDRTLVAHNARFDYGFLKQEFQRIGIRYQAKPLCSVKLSRQLFPQFKRHGLDQIIKRFNLVIQDRHRAMDDAEIIYRFFRKVSQLFDDDDVAAICQELRANSALPTLISKASIDQLPKAPGVYYFYDAQDKLLYVGKSVNIRQRVLSHFSQDHSNHKDQKINQRLAHIDSQRTPSDFGAQLLESREIKASFPLFNHRLRRVRKLVRYRTFTNETGYLQLHIETVNTDIENFSDQCGLFRSQKQAKNQLEKLADQHQLCHRLLGLESGPMSQACFRYQLQRCSGACVGSDSPESYNARLKSALSTYQIKTWPWQSAILIEERDLSDKDFVAYHLVNQWQYIAQLELPEDLYQFGYQPESVQSLSCKQIIENTNAQCEDFDLDTYFILARFLLDDQKQRLNGIKIWPLIDHTKVDEVF